MSAAEELRAAAGKIRAAAEAASPDSWESDCGMVTDPDGYRVADARDSDDAAYIATMHPGVGAALADWLESTAATIEAVIRKHEDAATEFSHWVAPALAVARAINGGPR